MRRKYILPILFVTVGFVLGVGAALLLHPGPASAPAPTKTPVLTKASPEPDTKDPAVPEIQMAFESFLREQPGRWNLYYGALPEGEAVWYASDWEPMVSASLIKLFIMGAVYEQIQTGAFEHDAVYPWLQAMITVSDNTATNTLITLLGNGDETKGMAAVNDWCRRQGYTVTRLNRLMLAENGLQNDTDAAECARFLKAVYRGDCVSPEASDEMLSLLLQQEVNDRLPAQLPEETPVAHKTGDLPGISVGDVGVIYSPGGDYLLCVIGNDIPDLSAGKEAIAKLSRTVFDLVAENPGVNP